MDVLIVEDDQEQLDGIESILLEKYDHMNCTKATNYQQATQLMHAKKSNYSYWIFLLEMTSPSRTVSHLEHRFVPCSVMSKHQSCI